MCFALFPRFTLRAIRVRNSIYRIVRTFVLGIAAIVIVVAIVLIIIICVVILVPLSMSLLLLLLVSMCLRCDVIPVFMLPLSLSSIQ